MVKTYALSISATKKVYIPLLNYNKMKHILNSIYYVLYDLSVGKRESGDKVIFIMGLLAFFNFIGIYTIISLILFIKINSFLEYYSYVFVFISYVFLIIYFYNNKNHKRIVKEYSQNKILEIKARKTASIYLMISLLLFITTIISAIILSNYA